MASNTEDMITLTSAEQDSGGANLSAATPPDAEDFVITNNSAGGIYEATMGVGQPRGSSTARSEAGSSCRRRPCSPSSGGREWQAGFSAASSTSCAGRERPPPSRVRSRQHSSMLIRNMPMFSTRRSLGRTRPSGRTERVPPRNV